MQKGILLAGEPMGLFIAQSEGGLDTVSGYSLAAAGAELNVAIGLTRLGHKAAYITKLGDDPFGRFLLHTLDANRIGADFVTLTKERTTGFMLKSRVSQGDPEIFYFRKGSAASTLSKQDLSKVRFEDYAAVHLTGILPALSASTCEAAFTLADRARENGLLVSFDPNLRPQLWESKEVMIKTVNALAAKADIVLPGEGEGEILCGTRNPNDIADFYLSLGAKAVVVKLGGKGAYLATKEERITVPGFPVKKIIDTVGAGDGFAVGVLSACVEGLALEEAVRRGNAIGALQVMNRGDNEGLPDREGLEQFMNAAL